MAKKIILMTALQTFRGLEGMLTPGTEFEVHTEQRAKELRDRKLADYVNHPKGVEAVSYDPLKPDNVLTRRNHVNTQEVTASGDTATAGAVTDIKPSETKVTGPTETKEGGNANLEGSVDGNDDVKTANQPEDTNAGTEGSEGAADSADTQDSDEQKADELPEGMTFIGGGFYQLSDGQKVQGKQKAIDAQNEINAKE